MSYEGIFSKFNFQYWANVSELSDFHSSWNHEKAYGFRIISEGIEVN